MEKEGEILMSGINSDMGGPTPAFTLNDLISAAQNEQWELVDANIERFCEESAVVDWAFGEGIKNGDGNVRDLAVSIIEKSSHKLEGENVSELLQRMEEDENPYVKFRSAFALFAHGNRSEKVIHKLKEALGDDDVKEVAEGYLSQIDG